NRAATAALAGLAVVLCAAAVLGLFLMRERREREKDQEASEVQKKDIRQTLEKNQAVNRVLLGALGRLGEVHADLKRSFHDSRLTEEDKRARFESHIEDVESFCASMPSDPSSRATALAVKGWLFRLGGRSEEAFRLFEESRKTDPEVAWGALFESMAWLSDYLASQRYPDVQVTEAEVEFGEIPPETAEMSRARERFEKLLVEAKGARVWGGAGVEDVLEAFRGFREIQRANFEKAESGLSDALNVPELSWLKEEFRSARARARYFLGDFEGGARDLEKVLERRPDDAAVRFHLASMHYARAAALKARGRDPSEYFRKSMDQNTECLSRDSNIWGAYMNRGNAHAALAREAREKGEDPRAELEKAVADYGEAVRLCPEYPDPWRARGTTGTDLGEARANQGIDPLAAYRLAVSDLTEAITLTDDKNGEVYYERANAYMCLGNALASLSKDPRADLRKAVSDFTEAIRLGHALAVVHTNLGNTYYSLGEHCAREGRMDPRPLFVQAVDQYDVAIAKDPSAAQTYCNRGGARTFISRVQAAMGEDSRSTIRKAVEDYSEAIRRGGDLVHAHRNRAISWMDLGDALDSRGEDCRQAYRNACSDFEEAIRRNPEEFPLCFVQGETYAKLARAEDWLRGRGEEPRELAVKAFERALKRNPDAWQLEGRRADLLEKLGRFAEAAKAYAKTLPRAGPHRPALEASMKRARSAISAPVWGQRLVQATVWFDEGDYALAKLYYQRGVDGASEAGAPARPTERSMLGDAHRRLAWLNAQAAEGNLRHGVAPLSVTPREALAFKTKAVAHLKKAMDWGGMDAQRAQREKLFISLLGGFPPFDELMKEWAKRE
ncbi:MAG: tetratricopeptide repeat protein, partial [Planctomycetota bacterium]